MRISDWSSDVCSSDLLQIGRRQRRPARHRTGDDHGSVALRRCGRSIMCHHHRHINLPGFRAAAAYQHRAFARAVPEQFGKHVAARKPEPPIEARLALDRKSTTSELQSLMRISYAVFCLKKKKKNT